MVKEFGNFADGGDGPGFESGNVLGSADELERQLRFTRDLGDFVRAGETAGIGEARGPAGATDTAGTGREPAGYQSAGLGGIAGGPGVYPPPSGGFGTSTSRNSGLTMIGGPGLSPGANALTDAQQLGEVRGLKSFLLGAGPFAGSGTGLGAGLAMNTATQAGGQNVQGGQSDGPVQVKPSTDGSVSGPISAENWQGNYTASPQGGDASTQGSPGPANQAGSTPPSTSGAQTASDPVRENWERLKGIDGGTRDVLRQQEELRQQQERENWEKLKGIHAQSNDALRQIQERELWERIKGLDPEAQQMIHGPSWPVPGTVSSPMYYRFHPKKKRWAMHNGIDIRNPLGEAVKSSESGTVIKVTPGSDGENQVQIRNRDGSISVYAHTEPSVKVGDKVYAGQDIGKTDLSGLTDAPHLHLGIIDKNGKYIDPLTRLPKRDTGKR